MRLKSQATNKCYLFLKYSKRCSLHGSRDMGRGRLGAEPSPLSPLPPHRGAGGFCSPPTLTLSFPPNSTAWRCGFPRTAPIPFLCQLGLRDGDCGRSRSPLEEKKTPPGESLALSSAGGGRRVRHGGGGLSLRPRCFPGGMIRAGRAGNAAACPPLGHGTARRGGCSAERETPGPVHRVRCKMPGAQRPVQDA